MKNARILIILFLLAVAKGSYSQFTYKIKADSLLVTNDSCNAELNLENHTRNVNGFLYNKGNGRTEFRKGLVKIDDTTYVVGNDSLLLHYRINGNNVYYVSRQFGGTATAIVRGLKKDSISSTNLSYMGQLSKAVPGSMTLTFPDPFSARNAVLDAIAAGKISNAIIVVMSGNSYTVGSDNPSQNGDLSYNANSNFTADIGFSGANSTTVASLCQNNINYYFEKDAQLNYINSAYQLWMSYQSDLTDQNWNSGVFGHGIFKQYYGQAQGFVSGWCYIDNANANFTFNSDYLELQYWKGFILQNVWQFQIDIDKIVSGYVTVLKAAYTRDGNGKPAHGYFNCPDFIYGQGKISNSYDDYWSAFYIGNNGSADSSVRQKDITVNINNAEIKVGCPEYDAFFELLGLANTNVALNIGNLHQTSSTVAWASSFATLIGSTFSRLNAVNFSANIKNAVTEYPLFGMLKPSSNDSSHFVRFNLYCGLHRKVQSSVVTDDWAKRNINIQNDYLSATVGGKLVIDGTFINECSSEVVAMDYTNMSKLVQLKGYYKTNGPGKYVMIFNGYQDKRIAITDATLINDGTVPSLALKGSLNGYVTVGGGGGIPLNTSRTIYIKNVHATAAADTNITTVGDTIKVVPDLASYY